MLLQQVILTWCSFLSVDTQRQNKRAVGKRPCYTSLAISRTGRVGTGSETPVHRASKSTWRLRGDSQRQVKDNKYAFIHRQHS
jgi:hypothetical protein